jgi:hypothetical protein
MEDKGELIEIWLPVCGYEGLYEVSNWGRVKTMPRYHRYGSKAERILSPAVGTSGYKHVALTKDGVMKTIRVHRIVALAFLSNPTQFGFVNHIDGIKTNNQASNLEWCDRSHNMKHAYAIGLFSKSNTSKLTKDVVCAIKMEGKWGSYKQIGDKYGVAQSTIYNILNYNRWQK